MDHFPLDMDEAAKLLDKHDLNDVLNKLPEEPFDLFNGMNFAIEFYIKACPFYNYHCNVYATVSVLGSAKLFLQKTKVKSYGE